MGDREDVSFTAQSWGKGVENVHFLYTFTEQKILLPQVYEGISREQSYPVPG